MKMLVVYCSYSGITRRLAGGITLLTNGESRELKLKKPHSYPYNIAVKEAKGKIERGYCPSLAEGVEPIGSTELVFVGLSN